MLVRRNDELMVILKYCMLVINNNSEFIFIFHKYVYFVAMHWLTRQLKLCVALSLLNFSLPQGYKPIFHRNFYIAFWKGRTYSQLLITTFLKALIFHYLVEICIPAGDMVALVRDQIQRGIFVDRKGWLCYLWAAGGVYQSIWSASDKSIKWYWLVSGVASPKGVVALSCPRCSVLR